VAPHIYDPASARLLALPAINDSVKFVLEYQLTALDSQTIKTIYGLDLMDRPKLWRWMELSSPLEYNLQELGRTVVERKLTSDEMFIRRKLQGMCIVGYDSD
jgi:hypothetical protein